MKKIAVIIPILTALFLSACANNQSDNRSDKEIVVDAFKSVIGLEQYELTNSVDINLEGEALPLTMQPYIELLNDATLSVEVKHDENEQKTESITYLKGTVKPFTIDLEVPMLEDWKKEKTYIATDSIIDNFGLMLGLPSNLKGKLIEFDDSQQGQGLKEIPSYSQLQDILGNSLLETVEEKSDDHFSSKEKGVYKITFTKDDVKNMFVKFMHSIEEETGHAINEGPNEDPLQKLKEEIDVTFEKFQFNTLEAMTTLDGDTVEDIILTFDIKYEDEFLGAIDLSGTMSFIYNSINEPFEFTIDPSDYEIIKEDEL